MGDGGAVVTSDDDLADKVRMLRNYGSSQKYVHEVQGVNSRLDELQASFLRSKLRRLDQWNASRQALAARYTAGLRGIGDIRVPEVPSGRSHVFHLYVIATARRAGLSSHLSAHGVHTLVHYPIPPHAQGAYAELGYSKESLPLAVKAADETLSLPLWPQMKMEQVDEVIALIGAFFA
jgi:dTDP-4-amino-4,6-dideoxygalactose transaminase